MMLASNIPENLENMTTGNAVIVAILGYGVVFLGLIALMCVVILIGRYFISRDKKQAAKAAAEAAALAEVTPAEEVDLPVAPGVAGQLKLHDVEPKTAAMIMAIVADKLGKPLNELRFISIKEVK